MITGSAKPSTIIVGPLSPLNPRHLDRSAQRVVERPPHFASAVAPLFASAVAPLLFVIPQRSGGIRFCSCF